MTSQGDPDLAFFLGEAQDGGEQRAGTATSKSGQHKPASAQSTDLLGLSMEEELTEEEELVRIPD